MHDNTILFEPLITVVLPLVKFERVSDCLKIIGKNVGAQSQKRSRSHLGLENKRLSLLKMWDGLARNNKRLDLAPQGLVHITGFDSD